MHAKAHTADRHALLAHLRGPMSGNAPAPPAGFSTIPQEIEVKIFESIELFSDQLELAQVCDPGLASTRTLKVLIEANKEGLFLNPHINEYIFLRPSFYGDNIRPRLRPDDGEDGISNPGRLTFEQLITNAKQGRNVQLVRRLEATRNNHLVRYRNSAVLQSKERRRQWERPSEDSKKYLSSKGIRINSSDRRTYKQLLQDFLLHPANAEINHAKEQDEERRLEASDKFKVMRALFDLLHEHSKLIKVCRGCLRLIDRKHEVESGFCFCYNCFSVYCKAHRISLDYLQSNHIVPSLLELKDPQNGTIWFRPAMSQGTVYYSKRAAQALGKMMYGDACELSSLDFELQLAPEEVGGLKDRFRIIASAVKDAYIQMHWNVEQNDAPRNLSRHGLPPEFFARLAYEENNLRLNTLGFAERAFVFMAALFDEDPEYAKSNKWRWLRESVARFWYDELKDAICLYASDSVYLTYSRLIKPIREWKHEMDPENKLCKTSGQFCSGKIAQKFSHLIHGCSLEKAANLPETTKARNRTLLTYLAPVISRILGHYNGEIMEILIDFVASVFGIPDAFNKFVHLIMSWAIKNLGLESHARYHDFSRLQKTEIVAAREAQEFWNNLVNTTVLAQGRPPQTLLEAAVAWTSDKLLIVPKSLSHDVAVLPEILRPLEQHRVMEDKERQYWIAQGTEQLGSIRWIVRTSEMPVTMQID